MDGGREVGRQEGERWSADFRVMDIYRVGHGEEEG